MPTVCGPKDENAPVRVSLNALPPLTIPTNINLVNPTNSAKPLANVNVSRLAMESKELAPKFPVAKDDNQNTSKASKRVTKQV